MCQGQDAPERAVTGTVAAGEAAAPPNSLSHCCSSSLQAFCLDLCPLCIHRTVKLFCRWKASLRDTGVSLITISMLACLTGAHILPCLSPCSSGMLLQVHLKQRERDL